MIGRRVLALAALVAGAGALAAPMLVNSPRAQRTCATATGMALAPASPNGEPAFLIDRTEVTNRSFAAFVEATGYVTEAEHLGWSAVFMQPSALPRGLDDLTQWWRAIEGASWRHPEGPASNLDGRWSEPVVHVTFTDAQAYARWRGGALPTEAQWERAALGAAPSANLGGRGAPANAWQGAFPLLNTGEDGHTGRAPVGCYAPGAYGLYDMAGNVWEWTYAAGSTAVLRGGSYLCADNFCANATPAGRQEQEPNLSTSHAGFRIVRDAPQRNVEEPR